MRQTNADLVRYYRIANHLYFKNALPQGMPLHFAKIKDRGVTLVLNNKVAMVIKINEDLRPWQAITIMTVLHEMLHVEKPEHTGHGWQFDQRMLRLAQAGAFDGNW